MPTSRLFQLVELRRNRHPAEENLHFLTVVGIERGMWAKKFIPSGHMVLRPVEDPSRSQIATVKWAKNEESPFETCAVKVSSAARAVEEDIQQIRKDKTVRSETEREQLVKARLGQGQFRHDLMQKWEYTCAVMDVNTPQVLRASHIKPWRDSSNEERLDAENGLLLAANLDALFDKYLISFSDTGEMLVSDDISVAERTSLGIPRCLRKRPTNCQKKYLRTHRERFEGERRRRL